jgi:hypothetical protein
MQNDRPVRDGLRSLIMHPCTAALKRTQPEPSGQLFPEQLICVQ